MVLGSYALLPFGSDKYWSTCGPNTSSFSTREADKLWGNLEKERSLEKTYFRSLILHFEAALRLLEEEEGVSEMDAHSVHKYHTRICFKFFDEMLNRYTPYQSLGVRLREYLYQKVYCDNPEIFDAKLKGQQGSVTYQMVAEEMKTRLEESESKNEILSLNLREKEREIQQLTEELKRAEHLKFQFVELEHSLRQKSSINKRLQKANDLLIRHNEDLEQQLQAAEETSSRPKLSL